MRVNPFVMPILIVVALFGTVFTAQAMGQWTTSGRVAIDAETMTAADLKGWMTLQDVMAGLKVSQSDLYAAGKIPADIPPSTALNKLESLVPGFSVTTLRDALKNVGTAPAPANPSTGTASQPTSAATPAPVAVATATPVTATPIAAATHSSDGTGTGPTPVPAGQVLAASQIKGSMSLRSVSQQAAVPLDKLIAGLKLPTDTNPDTLLKDLVAQGKIAEVTAVQTLVGELQRK